MNGVVEIPHAHAAWYNRTLLERALPMLLHGLFAQIRDIPQNNTDVIKFRKYAAFAVATTPLTPGVTPVGKKHSVTDITCTVRQYGDYVPYNDFITITTLDPMLVETAALLGEQAGQTADTLMRDVMAAGTNVLYVDATVPAVNAQTSDVAAADLLTSAWLSKGELTLRNANAKPMTSMSSGSTVVGSTPIPACFIGIIHSNTTYDLENEAAATNRFKGVETYTQTTKPLPGEVGRVGRVRLLETTMAKVKEGLGNGGIDVYCTLLFGQNAYGMSRISGKAMENIIKAVGSAGAADPLNQRGSSGWKMTWGGIILQQLWLLRMEHATAAS